MKQNYAVAFALFAVSSLGINASTYNLNFHCENHSDLVGITVQENSDDYDDWSWSSSDNSAETVLYTFGEEKDLTIPYDPDKSTTIHVKIIDDNTEYYIDNISCNDFGGAWKSNGNKDWQIYTYSSGDDVNFDISVTTDEEKYKDILYLKVDDPAQANISFSPSYRGIDSSKLVAGEYTPILFDAANETDLYIYNTDYSKGYYKLFRNDVDVTDEYYYGISISAGDYFEVRYNYPDVTCQVKFKYTTEEAKGCVKSVTMNGSVPEDLTEDGFSAKLGASVVINADDEWYKVTSMTINGESPSYLYFPYSIKILEDTEIEFTATKFSPISFTVNVDDPSHIKFYRGNTYNGTLVQLVAGDNTIELSANKASISIVPKSGATIESIKDADNNELYPTSSWSTTASFDNISDGAKYTITTSAIERNNVFVLYFDDPTAPKYGYNFERGSDRTYLNEDAAQGAVPAGYSVYYFGDTANDNSSSVGENVFTFACYDDYYNNPELPKNLYLNDELVASLYETSASWELTLADKDVVKLFFASNPEFSTVSFDVEEGVEVSAVKDLVKDASVEDGFKALPGTQVDLKFNTTTADSYEVSLNDEKVEVSDNAYSFNVSADTVVKVAAINSDGVASVSADIKPMLNNVYNLQGICVIKNASRSQLNQLPAGIYIYNGKKITVK